MPTEDEKNVFLQSLKKEPASSGAAAAGIQKKKGLSGVALFATLFLLFLLVITLLIFIMSVGGAENPILQSFGIQSGEVKQFLQGLVNWTFGTLIILLLMLFASGLFYGLTLPKTEKQKRHRSLLFGFVSGGLIFAVVLMWLLIFAYITRLPASADARNSIEVLNIDPGEKITAPLTISFSAAKIEQELERSGKRVQRFLWDREGDGTFEVDTGKNPQVNLWFTEQGKQVVRLLVEIENEPSQTFEVAFIIDAVVFAATPAEGAAPLKVLFDAREVTQNLAVKSFEWDFNNDGVYELAGQNSTAEYVFETTGVFPVHLRVLLQDGRVLEFSRDIVVSTVNSDRLRAVISADPVQGSAPLEVEFSAQNSVTAEGEITSFVWNFGNGEERRGEDTTYTFPTPGKYRVELQITNDQGLENTATADITVTAKTSAPTIKITTTPRSDDQGVLTAEASPLTVKFDASGTVDPDGDIVSFDWDFDGDGNTDAAGEEASYTFHTSGNFPVTLTVKDAAKNISTKKLTVNILSESVQARITANPETGSVPLTIDFDGSKSDCGLSCSIISYEWNFGDGTPPQITGAHTTHTYNKVGTFRVELKITSTQGKIGTGEKIVAVRVPPLKACFTPSRTSGPAPLTASFQDCSSGTIAQWKWDFGDGVISTERAPTHTFTAARSYTVTLSITDENGTSSQTTRVLTAQ